MSFSAARRWLALLPVVLTLSQCAQLSNTVSVVGRNFGDEIQQSQNLIFSFSKRIAPDNAGNWETTPYITFKPAVKGQFKWTSPSELVFSPATAFDPATSYRAELSKELIRNSTDKDLSVSGDEINFHTPYLQLVGTETWWTRAPNNGSSAAGQPVAKTRLRFNYPVAAAEVASRLGIRAEDKPVTAGPIQAQNDTQAGGGLVVTLTDAPATGNETPLALTVDKGLKVPNTAYTSNEPIEQTTTLPSPSKLDITDVQTGFASQGGTIRVVTTQTLQAAANLSQYYTIQPAVATTAELTENGLLIKGNFNETDTYVVTFTDAMRGVLNARLAEPVTRDVFFGKMPASLQFATRNALYLSSKGTRNVGLNITNVSKVNVRISRLYENNLLQFLKNNRYEEYEYTSEGIDESATAKSSGHYTYNNDGEGNLSDLLVDKTVQTADLPKVRGVSALNLAMPDQNLGDPKHPLRGAYLVAVQSTDEAYTSAVQLVSISDIGLIVRQTDAEILVWANSIQSAEPLKDIEITLVSSNNQSVYTLKTDGKGFAQFDKLPEKAPGFTIELLTARSADQSDFNFLYLPDTGVETSRFEVDGKRANKAGLNAFVYGDRTIYRPGETIHLNTILRPEAGVQEATADVPLTVRVLMPNGSEYRVFRKVTDAQGAVQTDIPVDPAAVTGSYTVEVMNASNVLLTSQAISIEEFIPDRIKVDMRTSQESYQTGQTIELLATAQNLFGPPAADRSYEVELQLKRRIFAPKGYGAYTFSIPAEATGVPATFEKTLRQGRTDASGQATERFLIPASYHDIGLLEAKLFVTVFDENGRPVNRLRRLDVQTQSVFYGIRLADSYLTTNTPLAVDVVGLNAAGNPQAAKAQVDVVRFDYQTVVEKQENGQIKYTSKRREKIVYTNTLTLAGKPVPFRYVPTVSGEYEVRVRRPGSAVGYTAADFYAYGYGSTSASSFEVSTEGEVLMEFDKPAYETGDKAKVLFKAPFEGKLLVTVERSGVMTHTWLTTENKAAEWAFSVDEDHLPNAYVTATLIRAMDGTDLPLTVAHGFASVAVTDPNTRLPVAIEAVAKSFSKTKQTIRVKTSGRAAVTVAVVDEGILQLKNVKTPDPHGYFFQKRALEVTPCDGYALLYPELSLQSRSSSGGDGYDLERRVNPLSNKRVQLVALWSGVLQTDGSGEAEYTIDIPQFSGTLRVMAVAYKDNAFGSAEQGMTVSDPIVISAGIPRFLSPGDELNMPVNLSNTTGKAAGVTAKVTVSGPLQVVADSTGQGSATQRQLTVQPGRESRTLFRVRATGGVGPGDITVTVSALGKTFVEKTDITVRPAAPLQKTTVAGTVAGGRTQDLTLGGNFLPGTTRNSLTISRSPVVQYAKSLSYLLGYPHGCTEQVISKAFPQLYFADLTKTVRQGSVYSVRAGESDYNPATNIQQALQQIENRQLYNGGVSLWPGFNQEDPWATAYALHFMVEAGKSGYEVSATVKRKLIDRLTTLTGTNRVETTSVFGEDGTRTDRTTASRTNLYGLYVLALADQPNRAAMSFYKESATAGASSLLTNDGRYLLSTTYARLGDQASSESLRPKQFADGTTGRETGDSYASPIRNLALVLNSLIDTDPDNLQIPVLARQLSTAAQQANYLNTQEAAFSFLALGKLVRQNKGSTTTATLTEAGRSGALGTFGGDDVTLRRLPTGRPLTLRTKGSGTLYYFGQSEGVPTSGLVPDEDHGLLVRRTYLNRDGAPQGQFRQNDLVVVKLTLSSQSGVPVKNVVLTDLLPAGFEVENPRLSGATGQNGTAEQRTLDWIKNASAVDHFDIRDDRVNYYLSVGASETKTVYYMVRAVSKGRFVVGPVAADAMYNPELRSYNGAGRVVVE